MNSLPVKYKESIFKRIIDFFRRTNKNKIDPISEEYSTVDDNKDNENNELRTNLQKEYNIIRTKKEILEEVIKNPDVIYSFSDDKLSKLIDILDVEIFKMEENILDLEEKIAIAKKEA